MVRSRDRIVATFRSELTTLLGKNKMFKGIKQSWEDFIEIIDRYLNSRTVDSKTFNQTADVLSYIDTIDQKATGYKITFIIADTSYLNQQYGKPSFICYFVTTTANNPFTDQIEKEPTNKFCWLSFSNKDSLSFDRFCAQNDFIENDNYHKLLTLLTFPQKEIRDEARKVLDLT